MALHKHRGVCVGGGEHYLFLSLNAATKTFQNRLFMVLHRHRRGGEGGQACPNNLRGGPTYPFNNPPTFFFNFYVKQEKSQMYQVEG